MVDMHLGDYEVVSDVRTPECSLRLLRLSKGKSVHLHYHQKTTQTYFVLEGAAEVVAGGDLKSLGPYQSLRIPANTPHSIRSEGTALVLSISIPPLERVDQHLS